MKGRKVVPLEEAQANSLKDKRRVWPLTWGLICWHVSRFYIPSPLIPPLGWAACMHGGQLGLGRGACAMCLPELYTCSLEAFFPPQPNISRRSYAAVLPPTVHL